MSSPTMSSIAIMYGELLLYFFKRHMTQEQRSRLMREHPVAYNAWMGREIVRTVFVDETRRDIP